MKFYLMFACGILVGFMFGYVANAAEPYKLPGYYENQTIVRPLLGTDIIAPTYHPVVIPKCYDNMAIHEIPCTEKQNEQSRIRNREYETQSTVTPHPFSPY